MDSSVPMDSAPAGWQLPPQAQISGENGGWANFEDFNSEFQAPRLVLYVARPQLLYS